MFANVAGMAEEIWDHEIAELAKIAEWLKGAPGFDKNKGDFYVDTVTIHYDGEPSWVATETDGISWVFTRAKRGEDQ